jgi:hypothetical protein
MQQTVEAKTASSAAEIVVRKAMNRRERRLAQRGKGSMANRGAAPSQRRTEPQHIHCVACGRHLDPSFFESPTTATFVRCAHGSTFASCNECVPKTQALLAEHDQSGQPVKAAAVWH